MKHPNVNHIGFKIKKFRQVSGLTQDELAKAINKTRSMVSHIERTGEANYYTLNDIASILNIPIDQLTNDKAQVSANLNIDKKNTASGETDKKDILVEHLIKEITYLKSVIENQWKVIFELSNSKK